MDYAQKALGYFYIWGLCSPKPRTGYSFFLLRCKKKEYRLRKKNTLYYSAALQRKTEWMSLNADAFNLLSLTITLRARSSTCLPAGRSL